jgi:hypothetical protein
MTIKVNDFVSYLDLKFDSSTKFTVILGSGIHKNASERIGNNTTLIKDFDLLTSWSALIKVIGGSEYPSTNNLLEFDKLLINRSTENDEQAFKAEQSLLQSIARKIIEVEKQVLELDKVYYPIDIFNPEFVSDVISLNYDHIPFKHIGGRVKKSGSKSKFKPREIAQVTENGINFWYPHGHCEEPNSMILSTYAYGKNICKIERVREEIKTDEGLDYKLTKDHGWFQRILKNPVLILGAGISEMEWDIWFALSTKRRNYARYRDVEQPIFKMVGAEEKIDRFWFTPIVEGQMSYNEQWMLLEKLLSKH